MNRWLGDRSGRRPRRRRLCGICAAVAALCTIGACGLTEPDVATEGTVRFIQVEGGCWVIETATATYDPVNLGEDLRTDGLRVRFEARFRDDLAHFCPGRMVELESIEPIGS